MLLDLYFAIVFFTLPLEGPEPNAVKGFGVETMRYGKKIAAYSWSAIESQSDDR